MSNNRYIVDWTQIGPHGPLSGIGISWDAAEAYDLAVDVASGLATEGGTWSVALLEISGEERATLYNWDHTTHGVNMWGELFEYSEPMPALNPALN